jgi:DNA (cytosine-5)-methyltransferase 1
MSKTIDAADLFCGAGGTSLGFTRACYKRGLDPSLVAINHWPLAIETHSVNLDYATHYCMSLDQINPREAVPSGHLHLLMASPECTHHCVARGGRPINDQSRATAWHVIKWAQEIYIENILIENVPEFQSWGPLKLDQTPDKRYKGQMFRQFIESLKAMGYNVDYRVLCAADYGDATTRQRLFIQARKKPRKITWPEPTHARPAEIETGLFAQDKKPWKAAREIIDWNIHGKSIFGRKRPLSPKTIKRIAAGLKKFNGDKANPFLLMLYGTGMVRDVDMPLPTVTASGQHIALCEPFILGQQSGGAPRSTDAPVPTVATKGAIALIEPFVMAIDNGSSQAGSPTPISGPISTVVTKHRHALIEPVATKADDVIPTEPFLIPQFSEHSPKSVDAPLGTVTREHMALVQPVLEKV